MKGGGVEGVREGWGLKKRSKVCLGGGGRGQGKNGGMRAQTPL
jgi:hypothetical protein